MKVGFLEPPLGEELGNLELHELIRDYPELFSLLHGFGIKLGPEACVPLKETLPRDDPRFDKLERTLRWRRGSAD